MTISSSTVLELSSPAAIGRSFFSGCFRSSSRSSQSLKTYVPEESQQKATNARKARRARFGTKTAFANTSGAKTATFLIHWRGRSARSHAGAFSALLALRPSDAEVDEPTLAHPDRVEDVPAVEDHGLFHQLLHPIEVRTTELVPLGEDEQPVSLLQCLVGSLGIPHPLPEVPLGNLRRDWIVGGEGRALPHQALEHDQRRCLPHVVRSGLESQSPDREVLPGHVPVVLDRLLEQQTLLVLVGPLDGTEQVELDPEVARRCHECLHVLGE